MIDLIFGVFLGVSLGIIVGITPGLHPNIVSSGILVYSGYLVGVSNLLLGSALITMAVSSNFFEFLKTMFLSVPDESNVMSNHPIHQLLLEQKGLEVIELIALGCLGSVLIALLLLPLGLYFVPLIYNNIRNFVPFILLFIGLHLTFTDKQIIKSLAIFLTSGILGIYVFNLELNDPFLPMLTGLFGLGMILNNLDEKIPGQFHSIARTFEKRDLIKSMGLGFLSAGILSFIPAIGPAQASLISEEMKKGKTRDKRSIIVSVAGVNTGDVFFSLIALKTISKARSGVLVVMSEILDINLIFNELLLSLFLGSLISYFLFIKIGKKMVFKIDKLNLKKTYFFVIFLVSIFVYLVNGNTGLWVLFLSSMLGLLTNKWKIRNSQTMGALIIPTLLFYF